ncbi:protein ELYS-like isoform X2 [Aricia agestis]|uniref:protein ELYS-like isoform X2 n=1 Tax=Aricia agestis TaxID=91739 RepID=UPI001C20470B|nr:protein ELYS-like isoform X2 [Aricia agestis]
MQKLQNSVFSILKTSSLSPAVFSFLQPTTDSSDQTPLGGILRDTKYGWLALGPKFCIVDLRSGLKIGAHSFEFFGIRNISVACVVELPTPLAENTQQLVISLECDDTTGMICVLNINGSQLLRCLQTDVVITKLSACDAVPTGPFECFDGMVMAGTQNGEIIVFDLNRNCLMQALKDVTNGYEQYILGEDNAANLIFLPMKSIHKVERQRQQALENNHHLAVLLNENSFVDGQYLFCNPDGTIRMKAKRDHVRVTVVEYIPQLGSLAVGFNFGAFQLWDLLSLKLEFTSQINVECLPVTHFGFQEPCDDPRAFCYLWVVFSVIDRREDEEFPLAVMYSLTYLGKRMLTDSACIYQDFSTATIRFQIELGSVEDGTPLVGGRCISCHTYSISSILAEEGEDTMLNLCQLVWECWGENINNTLQHGMLLFDLDQWYKDQMPATYNLESSAFMSTAISPATGRGANTLDLRLDPTTLSPYSHATRLEEHFYPNSLQYSCVCLNTSEALVIHTVGIQRQIVRSMWEAGPGCLLRPARLHTACLSAGLTPLYGDTRPDLSPEEQRRFLLSVALEARLSRFLKRCAQDWATGTHSGVGCTLTFLTDWCWKRAIELKENAKELTAPLFTSSILPDKNVVRCLEHCVQQLGQLTGLLDAILTKCCNLVIPEALSETEEKYKGVGTVSLYFQVVQWFLRVGLLPERAPPLPYPARQLRSIYYKRRWKLHRLQDKPDEEFEDKPCELLYIDQLIEHEFGGEAVYSSWRRTGDAGTYPASSLAAVARLYLRADVHHDHKHALLLYLLLDYCALYDDVRYEAVIRRLMQFPTMFGLSNTAIKATQAFWHLDHRDFDFALDQLQCLTGNTLSDWQHKVVLSALLAQKKSQAALQYLHVRKPAPIHKVDKDLSRINEYDKLEDWQSCCNLYLARGLVFEALDVIRTCVKNAPTIDEKAQVLNFFYEGCRNTGQLSKVLQVSLLPFEEEVFIKYLQDCNDVQTSDILLLYYLQQARYLEAELYCTLTKSRHKGDVTEAAHTLVDVAARAVPHIATQVARTAAGHVAGERVVAPKPMSVFIQASSPKNSFTYKSSFIQDTIENASETWVNKPKTRKGIKRALNIEETPFICTPKLTKTKSYLSSNEVQCTPPKRPKIESTVNTATPVSATLSRQMAALLDMPEPSPIRDRLRPDTPQSILKNRHHSHERDMSPTDSRYLGSDDEMETASNHTNCSDAKHLRFTIPTASESGSTPSPVPIPASNVYDERASEERQQSEEKYVPENDMSPPKKFAVEDIKPRKTLKDTVRARKSLSISVNSSLSEDPSMSIESIADISVTLLNPRHPRHRRSPQPATESLQRLSVSPQPVESLQRSSHSPERSSYTPQTSSPQRSLRSPQHDSGDDEPKQSFVPKTPQGRRSIRRSQDRLLSNQPETPSNRRVMTPERVDSPIVTPLRPIRGTRSRSRTPELSPKALAPIPELAKEDSEPHPPSALTVPRILRSRSRTPERVVSVMELPRLEAIAESPTKEAQASPTRRSLRSRSRTPEVEVVVEQPQSPRSLKSRSKTPEKMMSPKKDQAARTRKSLSRMVLEHNTFAKSKQTEKTDSDPAEENNAIECTPMKASGTATSLLDVTFSPIVNKSVLQSPSDSIVSTETSKNEESDNSAKLPDFTTINYNFSKMEKSVLRTYHSSMEVSSSSFTYEKKVEESVNTGTSKLPSFGTISDNFGKSVLKSCESSVAETSSQEKEQEVPSFNIKSINETGFGKSVLGSYDSSVISEDSKTVGIENSNIMTSDSEVDVSKNWKSESAKVIQKEKEKIVEIEREINEIEGEMSEDECRAATDSDEEMAEEEEESNESSENTTTEDDDSEGSEENMEVISIVDSDDSDSGGKLEIDEPSSDVPAETENAQNIPVQEEKLVETQSVFIEAKHAETATQEEDKQVANEVEKVYELNTQAAVDEILGVDASCIDPLNQGHLSMLTDDNSVIESDQSVNLNYSDEKVENAETAQNRKDNDDKESEDKNTQTANVVSDKEQQVVVEQETKEIQTENKKEIETSEQTIGEKSEIETVGKERLKESEKESNIVMPSQTQKEIVEQDQVVTSSEKTSKTLTIEERKTTDDPIEPIQSAQPKTDEDIQTTKDASQEKKDNMEVAEDVATKEKEENVAPEEIKDKMEVTEETTKENELETQQEEVKKSRTRKRSISTSSNKSKGPVEKDEPRTPMTRKRSQSITEAQITPETKEEESTPNTRRRAKTPSSEVRRILTRRASKELSESKIEEEVTEEVVTPKRSTRKSKKDDDNASVVSDSSTKSNKSAVEEVKAAPIRKGRKSILSTKTDLSVIPETTTEEASKDNTQDILNEYSTARRLTRHQKAVLDSWLEPRSPQTRRSSRPATPADNAPDDDEGSVDTDGTRSPDSSASKTKPARSSRAASETKVVAKPLRATRRISEDVAASPEVSSPASRGRRASFNRAVTALHTPTRRTSTDQKSAADSREGSPVVAEVTTPRRGRRPSATGSATRSRKTSEKNKE